MSTPSEKRPCAWARTPLYETYHDTEWGVPVHDDRLLFEFIVLEGAQAGLSWETILNKRENYRRAFDHFDVQKVARYDEKKVAALLQDAGIVRNRLKVASAITNANAFLKVQAEFGTFDAYIWRFVEGKPIQNAWKSLKQIPPRTPLSDAISRDLKQRGFKFVGSTIIYAHMQATGMINDHLIDCPRHKAVAKLEKPPQGVRKVTKSRMIRPPRKQRQDLSTGLLIFISGPSGVGKSTVCRRLATTLPAEFALSATTRKAKSQDAAAKKYLFVEEPEFRHMLEAGEFLEYAYVFGNWYGTLRKPVEEALAEGRIILLEIDVQGAIQVHTLFPSAMGVFILPPDEKDLLHRLQKRGRDDEADILKRFTEAQQEIRTAQTSGVYDLMVVNEDNGVEKTVENIRDAADKFRGIQSQR